MLIIMEIIGRAPSNFILLALNALNITIGNVKHNNIHGPNLYFINLNPLCTVLFYEAFVNRRNIADTKRTTPTTSKIMSP